MISIFFHSADSDDLKNWRWKEAPEGHFLNSDKGETYIDVRKKTHRCHVRVSSCPTVVLPPEDPDAYAFFESILSKNANSEQCVDGIRRFHDSLRTKLVQELAKFFPASLDVQTEPLCVFIHFGGEKYSTVDKRLKEAWRSKPEGIPNAFLCFAITRSGDNGINEAWRKQGNGGYILELPDRVSAVLDVLKKGCKRWGVQFPDAFEQIDKTASSTTDDGPHNAEGNQPPSSNGNPNKGLPKGRATTRRSSWFANVLKVIISLEMISGFSLALLKCWQSQSFASEMGFGVLVFVFLMVPVGICMAMHDEESDSSGTTGKQKESAASTEN